MKNRLVTFLFAAALVTAPLALSQTSSQASDSNQSWTSTSESGNSSAGLNPTQTTQSHSESNGRTIDQQSVKRRGPDGQYETYQDTEKETIKVDSSTVRTVERFYGKDVNGGRTLLRVVEEESHTLPGNGRQVVRTTSSPDVNGTMALTKREIQETKQTSADVQDTKTSVLTPSGNGGLETRVQTEEREIRRSDHLSEFRKSTLFPDGNGNWRVNEVREGTIQDTNGKERIKQESILRPDAEGKLAVAERTVTHESEAGNGEKRATEETFSNNVPGGFGDGTLRLSERRTTVENTRPDGTRTKENRVEQRNAGEPGAGLRLTQQAIDIVRPTASGSARETRTIQSRDANGGMGTVWVDMGQSTTTSSVEVDTKKNSNGTAVPAGAAATQKPSAK